MSDSVEAVSEVSSSSSSSSSRETHESHETTRTQSTSETSSSSSSSFTNKAEETHKINTSDSTNISSEAREADEADGGSSVNMSWMNGDSEALKDELNQTYGQLLVDYERTYTDETTFDINDLPQLDKYGKNSNCANFQSSIADNTGGIEKQPYSEKFRCSPDDTCDVLDDHLKEDGWKKVDISEAQAGDIVIMLEKKDDSNKSKEDKLVKGHTEMVTGVDKNGNISLIGSNNLKKDDPNTREDERQIQEVNEHTEKMTDLEHLYTVRGEGGKPKYLDDVSVYHKDYTIEDFDKISESLENNSIAANSTEKLGEIEEKLASGSLSKSEREKLETQKEALQDLISDISKFSSELEKLHELVD